MNEIRAENLIAEQGTVVESLSKGSQTIKG